MLHDPKRDVQYYGKTLEGFIAWLEMQPAEGKYNYYSAECAVCQWLWSHGLDFRCYGYFLSPDERILIASPQPWTFGAALSRARKYLAERQ